MSIRLFATRLSETCHECRCSSAHLSCKNVSIIYRRLSSLTIFLRLCSSSRYFHRQNCICFLLFNAILHILHCFLMNIVWRWQFGCHNMPQTKKKSFTLMFDVNDDVKLLTYICLNLCTVLMTLDWLSG